MSRLSSGNSLLYLMRPHPAFQSLLIYRLKVLVIQHIGEYSRSGKEHIPDFQSKRMELP